MKGDFTRFTFQPAKHYTRVFMQQGRLQLDADWNEQMDIQAYLNLRQAQHMIGATAGTPGSGILKDGFKITATPDGSDLIIHPGQFYVGGVLCELTEGTIVKNATYLSENRVRVPFLAIDGQPFTAGQWIQIAGAPYRIKEVNRDEQTLTLSSAILQNPPPQSGDHLTLSRLTTYLTQPDYPNPTPPELNQSYLVYLDVWQRHVTAIEDPEIREIALTDVPDTTTRVKTIWQVKLKQLSAEEQKRITVDSRIEDIETTSPWKEFIQPRDVSLTAQAKPTTNGLSDPRIGNQLYRVEIHKGGGLNEARFKWSRDNGTVVSAIKEFRPQENAIVLPKPVRDTAQSFAIGQWVEISDDVRELNNQPGTLVRLKDVVVRTEDKLIFDPATIVGDPIDDIHFHLTDKPKVRRWDWSQNEPGGLAVAATDPSGWIELEYGIQVKFETQSTSTFETGDYWLIPTRLNPLKPIDWPQDAAKTPNPLPQAALGIYHQFGLLALTIAQTSEPVLPPDAAYWDKADKRTTFPPLINCFDKNGDSFPGPLGIGVKPPLAQLHVKGASAKTINHISIQGSSTITGDASTRFMADLHPGDWVAVAPTSGATQTRIITEVNDNQTATVDRPFTASVTDTVLSYQQPVLRLDTSDDNGNPQFLLNAAGNIGIGTNSPTAKLEIQGATKDDQAAVLQATNSDKTSLLFVRNDGNVGIGFPDPQAHLDVKGIAQVRTATDPKNSSAGFFKIETKDDQPVQFTTNKGYHFNPKDDQPIQFTTNKGYKFDKDITIESGILTGGVQLALKTKNTTGITILDANGNVGIGFDNPQAHLDVKDIAQIRTATDPNSQSAGFFKIETQDDQPVQFTTNKGYHFNPKDDQPVQFTTNKGYQFDKEITINKETTINKDITLTSGNLVISTGFIQLGTDRKIQSIDKGIQIITGASNVQIALDNSQVKFTATNQVQYTFDKSIQIGTDAANLKVALDSSQVKFTTTETEYLFDQPISVSAIHRSAKTLSFGTAAEEQASISSTGTFSLFGQAILGIEKTEAEEASKFLPENGLLVAGNVRIGKHNFTDFGAKLEIESTQFSSDDKKNKQAFALNIQTGDSQLFSIQNTGDVTVNQRLLITASDNATQSSPLKDDSDIKLYVEGKVFGRDLTTGKLQVLSSRTLKQNIVQLSSQEVDEILRSLNPVKFTYTADQEQKLHLGFVAEDVPDVVAASDRQAINPVDIVAALTKVVKDHRQAILSLNRIMKEQQKTIEVLTQKINALDL